MLSLRANAKINWFLSVLAIRDDGYHELDMLMQSISLCDTLTFQENDSLSLSIDGGAPGWDEHNLICRAASLLRAATGCQKGAAITLRKRIPSMAGLGGGSSDCAATLTALNDLWSLGLPRSRLIELGLTLGADLPFCLTGGLARVRGIGERIEPLHAPASPELILLMPNEGLSTGAVFRHYDVSPDPAPRAADCAEGALLAADYDALSKTAVNSLTRAAAALAPSVSEALGAMRSEGARFAAMSGSGSCVFGVFDQPEIAYAALSARYPVIFRAQTRPCGVELI